MSDQLLNQINARLSLREPQRESLRRLADVLGRIAPAKDIDVPAALQAVRAAYPDVTDFERDFPSLCFALATGVGKTRLMGAFIAYLYLTGRSKHFFVLAPNLTIYEKLITDFSPGRPKYVFKGLAEFAKSPPVVVTGDNYAEGRGLRRHGELFDAEIHVNLFNVSKINSEVRGGKAPRIKRLQEYVGESYFEYLSRLPDLVLLMDEAHRYRASAGVKSINELKPILGLELTATPKDFKNVIYRYELRDAMADGFVKEPAVATRENFDPKAVKDIDLERIKLEDGIRCHELAKVRLELYARRSGYNPVHPFMLVVATDIEHAKRLRTFMESDAFYEGKYKGKVIEVHSGQSSTEREKTERQLVALESDKSTEIVIHVNKLNEGWDVTNLYTIVPLRAFAAEILTEQTLGRGLRLPYGERTGDDAVDRLTVIAHDHFDEIIKRAKEPGSIVMKEVRIGAGGDVPTDGVEIVEAKPVYETKLAQSLGLYGGFNEEQQRIIEVTKRVLDEEARRLPGGFKDLEQPEVQDRIAARVEEIVRPVQGSLPGMAETTTDVGQLVKGYTTSLVTHSIEIPEIWIRPSRTDITFGFSDFDLARLDRIRMQPLDGKVIVEDLRTGNRETIDVETVGAREPQLENYLVRRLVDMDEVDYDQHSELLFKLAGQMVAHLKTYLKEQEAEAVLRSHSAMLADLIFEQMREHAWETPTTYEPVISKGFKTLSDQPFGKERSLPLRDYREPAVPLSDTRKYLFKGFKRCGWDAQRFHSDGERRFAALIEDRESSVKVWIKPTGGVFNIAYTRGHNYEPDFLVETATEMLICEVKAPNELNNPVVQAKAKAAREWVKAANTVAAETGRKPWRYALIPDPAIVHSATLNGLFATYGS